MNGKPLMFNALRWARTCHVSALGKGGEQQGKQATQMWKTDKTRGHSKELCRALWRAVQVQ